MGNVLLGFFVWSVPFSSSSHNGHLFSYQSWVMYHSGLSFRLSVTSKEDILDKNEQKLVQAIFPIKTGNFYKQSSLHYYYETLGI